MVVVAVKNYCTKNGKRYGPYPKNTEVFYLYRVYREGNKVRREYLGKGPKPSNVLVREIGRAEEIRSAKYIRYLEGLVEQENECRTRKTTLMKVRQQRRTPRVFESVEQENVKPKQTRNKPNS